MYENEYIVDPTEMVIEVTFDYLIEYLQEATYEITEAINNINEQLYNSLMQMQLTIDQLLLTTNIMLAVMGFKVGLLILLLVGSSWRS